MTKRHRQKPVKSAQQNTGGLLTPPKPRPKPPNAGKGRPKGSLNKATIEGREFCLGIVNDPKYRANLRKRAVSGKLHPSVENMLWDRAKGKVKETIEHLVPMKPVVVDRLTPGEGIKDDDSD